MYWLDEDFVIVVEKVKEWMVDEEIGGEIVGVFVKLEIVLDVEVIEKFKVEGEVVYLFVELNEILMELKFYSMYIIGGLVDKN